MDGNLYEQVGVLLQDARGALNRRPSVTVQHILLYAADFIGNLRFTWQTPALPEQLLTHDSQCRTEEELQNIS